jgi:hypothetical protein
VHLARWLAVVLHDYARPNSCRVIRNDLRPGRAIVQLLDHVELRVALARKLIEEEFDVLTNSAHLRGVFREAAAPVAMGT